MAQNIPGHEGRLGLGKFGRLKGGGLTHIRELHFSALMS